MTEDWIGNTFRQFILVWFGQLISLIGSGMTSFALGIWVFERTRSVTSFSLILVFAMLPRVAIAPFAGVIVDRSNRRMIMLWSDLGAGFSTLILAFLFFIHRLQLWEIYILLLLGAAASAFRFPANLALLSQLVPKRHIGRASGMMQLGTGAAQVLSPILAAALIGSIGFAGIVLIDFTTFLFAVAMLVVVTVPTLNSISTAGSKENLWKQMHAGWSYILARPGLIGLLIFFVYVNITLSFSQALLTPMVLDFADAKVLAVIMTTGAAGFLAGSILISAWGGPARKVHGLLASSILYAVGLSLTGLRPSALLVTVGLFLSSFQMPIMNGCSQAIWQSKIALEIQGRVFGTRIMIAWLSNPLAYFVAGVLADHILEPLLAIRGPLAHGPLNFIGTGPGRGIALFLILNGILMLTGTIMSFYNRHFWHVEEELPDAVGLISGNRDEMGRYELNVSLKPSAG